MNTTVTTPSDVSDVVLGATPETTTPTTEAPASTGTVRVTGEGKADNRRGPRKTVSADGSVSYGVKADGTPRRKPGRPSKAS